MARTTTRPPTINALEVAGGLIKPHLKFDPSKESHRNLRSIERIVCTHGATIDAVARLARDGYFSGGSADETVGGRFFATPNPKYAGWNHTKIGQQIGRTISGQRFDAIMMGIVYSEMEEADTNKEECYKHNGPGRKYDLGAVITFGSTVLVEGTKVDVDLTRGDSELVLPEAPNIDTIEGIYPVDENAAHRLHTELSNPPIAAY